eukprot:TRINITY_DN1045_c0_g1_i3.p1 TRINITY_DN1045_c0_g1~~TRINITY_DN1045_c0_g1_i3.p1  ORF type:complete len:245 (+),score=62.55 TRINITY_DN1045_c0_g1_i3:39-737(+)
MSKSAVVIGGTGAVGKELIRELVQSGEYREVRALVRKERDLGYFGLAEGEGSCLVQKVVDFEKLDDYADEFKGCEYGFSAFGTTRREAGGAEPFKKIDYGYNVKAADLMKQGGVKHMQLVSAQGADTKSWLLYPKTKGEIEDHLKSLAFDRLTIWRPGLLAGRHLSRTVETAANCICPNFLRVHVRTVARGMHYDTTDKPHSTEKVDIIENNPIKKYVEATGGKDALFNKVI